MTTITNEKSMLNTVTLIRHKYEEIAKLTGENFNIFSVLRIETDEVRLHSRLIGELLDPNGSHNQKETFLALFIETIGLKNEYTIDQIKSARVFIEENIGAVSDDYLRGGRIDIVISFSGGRDIVIENKIWAGDQYFQLARYFKEYPASHILYLTPFGSKPSEESLGNIKEYNGEADMKTLDLSQVMLISYFTHIKGWLQNCLKETYQLPLLREVLNHYLNIVNKITNQSRNLAMNKQIEENILSSEEAFKSAELIHSTVLKLKLEREELLWQALESIQVELAKWKDYVLIYGLGRDGGMYHMVYAEKAGVRVNQSDAELDELFMNLKEVNNRFKRSNSCLIWFYSDFGDIINSDSYKYIDENNREELIAKIITEGKLQTNEIVKKINSLN